MKMVILILLIFNSFISSMSHAQKSVVVVPLPSEDAVPGVAAFANQANSELLTGENSVIVSLSMTFPSKGKVIINASGHTAVFTQEFIAVPCSINKNRSTVDFSSNNVWQTRLQFFGERDFSTQGGFALPFSGTRGFNVNTGTDTFMLVCSLLDGENVQIRGSHLTAMFFPD